MGLKRVAKAPATFGVGEMKIEIIEDCATYPCKERKKPVLCFGVCALLALLPPSFNICHSRLDKLRRHLPPASSNALKDVAHA